MKTDFLEEISCPLYFLYIGLIKSSNVTATKEFSAVEIVLRLAQKIPGNICKKFKIRLRLNKYSTHFRFKIFLNYKYKKLCFRHLYSLIFLF